MLHGPHYIVRARVNRFCTLIGNLNAFISSMTKLKKTFLKTLEDARGLSLSVVEVGPKIEMEEAKHAAALVATDLNPSNAAVDAEDIQRAILAQFQCQAQPAAITKFGSDFVVQFDSVDERDLVVSSEVLQSTYFDMLVVPWSIRYGARVVDWQTEVAIDVSGFPPHAFDPISLGPLLSTHCSIQAYRFFKPKGICRVFGYALSTNSIPSAGHITLQYQLHHGVRNMVFPVTMQTYPYSEAPQLDEASPEKSIASIRSYDTGNTKYFSSALMIPNVCSSFLKLFLPAEEFGYDREVLQEAYERMHIGNIQLKSPRSVQCHCLTVYWTLEQRIRSLSVEGTLEMRILQRAPATRPHRLILPT